MRLLENNWGKVRCHKCDSVMDQIEKDDLYENEDGHYIICPVCSAFIWFNDKYEEHHIVENALSMFGITHK